MDEKHSNITVEFDPGGVRIDDYFVIKETSVINFVPVEHHGYGVINRLCVAPHEKAIVTGGVTFLEVGEYADVHIHGEISQLSVGRHATVTCSSNVKLAKVDVGGIFIARKIGTVIRDEASVVGEIFQTPMQDHVI